MNPPRCTTKRRLNALTIARMTVALQKEPCSVHDVADITGLSLYTARHYVLALHREGGCFIEHWEQDKRGRHVTPAYRIGLRKDCVKPRQSREQKNAALRAKREQLKVLFALAA